MKFCTFQLADGSPRPGVWTDRGIVDLQAVDPSLPATLRGILALGEAEIARAKAAADAAAESAYVAHADATMLPPIQDPAKIICIGLNYRDHAAEVKLPLPDSLAVFAKWPNTLIGNGAAIVIPPESYRVDYEAELAVVVGRRARRVAEADALGFVAGYMNFNDVSVRDYQARTSQWTIGKVFDTHGPCGPFLVTCDAVPDPQKLRIRTTIGEEVLQDSSTAEMVFGVARIVAELSAVMTLEPGDIVATGTPAGVGTSRNPRRWIKPGERVRVEIERLGVLENPAVAG
jgi:2-keto-4-pentenoate hydratase/2-oxohepta-3-ene-1,7-dioic acid hydratase in catechol pathway